jgi:hypothetical protein
VNAASKDYDSKQDRLKSDLGKEDTKETEMAGQDTGRVYALVYGREAEGVSIMAQLDGYDAVPACAIDLRPAIRLLLASSNFRSHSVVPRHEWLSHPTDET